MADELATRIRTARDEAGLKREHIAVGLGVSLATVTRMETGRTQRISAETLIKIGQLTGKPLSYFIGPIAA